MKPSSIIIVDTLGSPIFPHIFLNRQYRGRNVLEGSFGSLQKCSLRYCVLSMESSLRVVPLYNDCMLFEKLTAVGYSYLYLSCFQWCIGNNSLLTVSVSQMFESVNHNMQIYQMYMRNCIVDLQAYYV